MNSTHFSLWFSLLLDVILYCKDSAVSCVGCRHQTVVTPLPGVLCVVTLLLGVLCVVTQLLGVLCVVCDVQMCTTDVKDECSGVENDAPAAKRKKMESMVRSSVK